MALSEDLKGLLSSNSDVRVLTFDIETTRAIVETFSLFTNYIHIDRVKRPSRVLCYSARWLNTDKNLFGSAWDDDDEESYEKMMRRLWDLLNEADMVVTWNGDRFDLQWVESECARLGMGRPKPYRSVDLIKVAKRRFKGGLMSLKLDWSSRQWLHDAKVKHSETDLWDDIRYGTRAQKRAAQATMRRYCIHDTELTEQLLIKYLPWLGINMALHTTGSEELLLCTKCGSRALREDGFVYTAAFAYQAYRCKDCGSTSRGKRCKKTSQLRSV